MKHSLKQLLDTLGIISIFFGVMLAVTGVLVDAWLFIVYGNLHSNVGAAISLTGLTLLVTMALPCLFAKVFIE